MWPAPLLAWLRNLNRPLPLDRGVHTSPSMGLEEAMSTVRGFALPAPPAASDWNLVKPLAIVARILRWVPTRSERRRLDRAAPARPNCYPAVPTFFPFNVRDLITQGCAEQREDRR